MTHEITMGGNTYPLRFGMGFLKQINKRAVQEIPNTSLAQNVGLQYYLARLLDSDLEALEDVIWLANRTETPKIPSIDVIDKFIEDECEDIQELFDVIMGFLETSNCTKTALQNLREEMEQAKQEN